MGSSHLTTRQREDIRLLHDVGSLSHHEISQRLGHSLRQVYRALREGAVKPRSGRPHVINDDEAADLINFVSSSRVARRMTYADLSHNWRDNLYGSEAIRNCLRRHGYRRYVAELKVPLSEKNRQLRLKFAHDHRDWTLEDWSKVLWSDETWVKPGRHTKTYVTRKPSEALLETCIMDRCQRKIGWMFWGSFHSSTKGPIIFWEKDWGSVNAESYQAHIVPIVDGWIQLCKRENLNLIFMQDGAPAHGAKSTLEEFDDRGVSRLQWVPFSPDLNPIESVWLEMKHYLQLRYGDIDHSSYDRLREHVTEAWNIGISSEFLEGLIQSMPARMEAVITANGGHTRY